MHLSQNVTLPDFELEFVVQAESFKFQDTIEFTVAHERLISKVSKRSSSRNFGT